MSSQTADVSTPTQEVAVPSTQGKHKRGNRGRPGVQKRSDEHRIKVGEKVMAANDKRISANTYQDLAHIVKALQQYQITPSKQTSILPQTTRGLGFTVGLTANTVSTLTSKVTVDPLVLYRTTMAQHYFQMHQASIHFNGHLRRPTVPSQEFIKEPFQNFNNLLALNKRNFAPLVAAVSCFGNVSFNDSEYKAILPKSSIYCSTTELEPSTSKQSKKECYLACDPFVLNFGELRSQLTPLLKGMGTPPEIRRYFAANNPIPGAIFDDEFYLTNIDDIIPANYKFSQLANDFRKLTTWLDILNGKFSYLIGEVHFLGKGQFGSVTNAIVDGYVDGTAVTILNEEFAD